MGMRKAKLRRTTTETDIRVSLNLDGQGRAKISTGIPFLDHMLTLVARHGAMDLELRARGDLEVDQHHTVEDTGLVLGEAVRKALGSTHSQRARHQCCLRGRGLRASACHGGGGANLPGPLPFFHVVHGNRSTKNIVRVSALQGMTQLLARASGKERQLGAPRPALQATVRDKPAFSRYVPGPGFRSRIEFLEARFYFFVRKCRAEGRDPIRRQSPVIVVAGAILPLMDFGVGDALFIVTVSTIDLWNRPWTSTRTPSTSKIISFGDNFTGSFPWPGAIFACRPACRR